jgi:hypothetical protein
MRRLRLAAAVAAVLVAGGLTAPAATGYQLWEACGGNILHWHDEEITYGSPAKAFPEGQIRDAWLDVLNLRNRNPGGFHFGTPHFDESHVGRTNADNEVWWTDDQDILDGRPAVHVKSHGCFHLVESDIVFDVDRTWSFSDSATHKDNYGGADTVGRNFRTGALHETGHAIGLPHENRFYNIMGQDTTHVERNGDTVSEGPGEDAIAGETRLYGTEQPDAQDIAVTHYKYDKASGEYSQHAQTGIYRQGWRLGHDVLDGVRYYPVIPGEAYEAEFTIENNGPTGTSQNVEYGLYISDNRRITTNDRLIATGTVAQKAGLPDSLRLSMTIPADLPAGDTRYLGIIVDRNDKISEYDEGDDDGITNNAAYLPIKTVTGCKGTVGKPSADFNGDGICDLAIGVPREDSGAGAVNIAYGQPFGLHEENAELVSQRLIGSDHHEVGDNFGAAVAAGEFTHDIYADLAVGVPGENGGAGRVLIFRGSPLGLVVPGILTSGPAGAPLSFSQDTGGVEGVAEGKDRFGAALQVGDFDAHGYQDLAVGVPGENNGAGAVNVLYGSPTGISVTGDQLWTQDSLGVEGVAESGDNFGASLAAGDFNGGNIDDLAVGVPREDGAATDTGAVAVLYGAGGGLKQNGNELWTQDGLFVEDDEDAGDQFGYSLTAGNFNGDGAVDLAVGVPFESNDATSAGAVHVLYGTPGSEGLSAFGDQLWTQNTPDVEGDGGEKFDNYGRAVAAGDFNGDGYADLAVGISGEDVGAQTDAGAVHALYGTSTGLGTGLNAVFTQGSDNVADLPLVNDGFGTALAAGNFDGGLRADLAIGVPGNAADVVTENGGYSQDNAGVVHVIYGQSSLSGLVAGSLDRTFSQTQLGGNPEAGDRMGESLSQRGHS